MSAADSFGQPERGLLKDDEGLLGAKPYQRRLKRFVDVALSIVAICSLVPIFIVAAVLIKLTSPGPVFHVQQRVGKGERPFRFVKFRSMQCSADDRKAPLLRHSDVDGPAFKMRHDPRVTSIGRFLRRTSIDELPQLFHVLKGDMSLVGPRPPLPDEVGEYGRWERQRLLVKPGLTCTWQVSGRSDLPFDTWMELDVEYIREWSPSLDAKILALTIPAVLIGRGAY